MYHVTRDSTLYREARSGELAGFCGTCARKHRKAHAVGWLKLPTDRTILDSFLRPFSASSAPAVFLGKLVHRALSEIEN